MHSGGGFLSSQTYFMLSRGLRLFLRASPSCGNSLETLYVTIRGAARLNNSSFRDEVALRVRDYHAYVSIINELLLRVRVVVLFIFDFRLRNNRLGKLERLLI